MGERTLTDPQPHAVVAGHICLDVIPTLPDTGGLSDRLMPGGLVEIGPAVVSTGGAVSNTGLALHRLGVPTGLMGKIGDDTLGRAILDVVRSYDPDLAAGMIVAAGEPSSYTVVINPPNTDRTFLHCPGANDTFGPEDVPYDQLASTRLFHFGYPPIMRRFYADGGSALSELFRNVRQRGVTTSLDLAYPDPTSASGQSDWAQILTQALPHVDLFLPSLEEILFMLDRPRFDELSARGDLIPQVDGALLSDLAARLLEMGVAVAAIKLGERGLYVRTTSDARRLATLERAAGDSVPSWQGRELLIPCYRVDVVGTTGCGDGTIAGFLAGLLNGLSLEETLAVAVGVGACTAEQADATSGVPDWATLRGRIAAGWPQHACDFQDRGWRAAKDATMIIGPNDRK